MSTDNTRKVLRSVLVTRDGKDFYPPIGKPFKFTTSELKDIQALNPRALQAPELEDELDETDPSLDAERKALGGDGKAKDSKAKASDKAVDEGL